MIEIAVAVVGGGFVLANTWLTFRLRRDMKTNHGHSAGYYLERVEDVATSQEAVLELIREHTRSDERQFDELKRQLDALSG